MRRFAAVVIVITALGGCGGARTLAQRTTGQALSSALLSTTDFPLVGFSVQNTSVIPPTSVTACDQTDLGAPDASAITMTAHANFLHAAPNERAWETLSVGQAGQAASYLAALRAFLTACPQDTTSGFTDTRALISFPNVGDDVLAYRLVEQGYENSA